MRRLLGLGMVVLAFPGPAIGQSFPAEMAVSVPEVEVRSGPSRELYPTSRLRQGDRVVVLRESKKQPGWLEIVPPPGSFSWVDARFVKLVNNQIGVIPDNQGPVPVMPGSSVINNKPNVESAYLEQGQQLVILDKPHQTGGQTWLPIKPPYREVRFIPADAVKPVVRQASNQVSASGGTGYSVLVQQADEAYAAGRFDQAKQLYKEASEKTSDYNQKVYCYNRITSLSQGSWNPPTATRNSQAIGLIPPAGKSSQPSDQLTSMYNVGQGLNKAQWSVWGILRRAAFEKDGQPMYVLENRQGQPLLYVTSAKGTSLRDFINRTVSLYGTLSYRSDDYLRMHYMVASHVAVP